MIHGKARGCLWPRICGMRLDRFPTRGVLGAVIGLGIMVAILVAIPAARWFLLFSIPAGLLVALILRYVGRRSE